MDLFGQKSKAPPAAKVAAPSVKGGAGELIVDGTQATFVQDVIEASRQVPVLVDFWATWCGPCKTLTPALERVVTAAAGRVKLVKIDIDANRALVQQLSQIGLPLQSVPTVAAFWQGQIADVFQGALPESELKRFVEALLKMAGGTMPSADLLAEAKAAVEAGDHQTAGAIYSELLAGEPESPEAWGGLIRTLIALGDEDQARQALSEVPPKIAEHAEISGARSALALAVEGRAARGQMKALQARVAADASDLQARYDLATALNATGARQEAADTLLDIVKRDRAWNDGAARLQLLKFFEAWGERGAGDDGVAPKTFGRAFQLMDAALTEAELPAEFPVFPLTGVLLLPGGRLPLNIFEPRYLAMIEDCLAERRMLGIMQPDSAASEDDAHPALFKVGCLGRLSSFSETDDGRYLITVSGIIRFSVAREVAMHRGYRRVQPDYGRFLSDLDPSTSSAGLQRETLMTELRGYFGRTGLDANWEAVRRMPDDMLVVTLAMACPFHPLEKQALLEAPTLAEQADTLIVLLKMGGRGDDDDDGNRMAS